MLALLGTVLVGAASPAAAAPRVVAPRVVALDSGGTTAGAQQPDAPDRASATRLAYRLRKPVLVTSLTSETAQTWALPDGTFKTSVALAPVRTQDTAGRWVDVDLTLVRRPDGSVAPRAQSGRLWLSGARPSGSDVFAAPTGPRRRRSPGTPRDTWPAAPTALVGEASRRHVQCL